MSELHDRIVQARKLAGYETARDAAEAFGFKASTYYEYENGRGAPSREALKKIAEAFRVSLEWLALGRGEPRPAAIRVAILGDLLADAAAIVEREPIGRARLPPESEIAALRVAVDGMRPRYHPDDLVLYEREKTPPQELEGKYALVSLADGRRLVRIIRKGSIPGRFTLASIESGPIVDVEIDEARRCLGVLSGCQVEPADDKNPRSRA